MSEKQLPEKPEGAAGAPTLIDVNTADVETLSRLPHVGRVVAGRIVEYRARQPFRLPEELMNVPGIGAAVYRDLADRITVAVAPPAAPADVEPASATPPDSPEPEKTAERGGEQPPQSVEAMPPPTSEPMLASAPPLAPDLVEPEPEPSSEAPQPEVTAEPAVELLPFGTKSPLAESTPLPPAPQPAPVLQTEESSMASPSAAKPPAQAPARDWNGLIGMSLLGALLGMIFTLLLLAGINRGTLILNQKDEVTTLSTQADNLSTRVTGLESTAKSLRTRLDTLEGLTGRMDEVEAALGKISSNLDALETEVGALNERADTLAAEVETFRAIADRFDSFLNGLRDLLANVPASPTPTASPNSSATPTPTP